MRFRLCFALLFLVSACTSAPAFVSPSCSHPRIQLVSGRMDLRQQSWIARADLDRARALLFQARTELEPRQWKALDAKLTSAEQAFERFSRAAEASGQSTEIMRGEGLRQAGRARPWGQGLTRAGPFLAFLALLYPASTAGPEIDHRPEWVDAREEYKARLREVAEESRRILEQLPQQETGEEGPDIDLELSGMTTSPPRWRTRINPATGRNYSSEEEYERAPLYPGQTCKNSLLDKLEAEKDQLLREVPRYNPKERNTKSEKKLDKVPCSKIRLRLEAMKKVLVKRWEIQKECFGGQADSGHNTAMKELENGLVAATALEARNCAPDHPMSER